ncbi:MAG: hypothetical protein A3F14_05340 [Gammaproteobacteria bacterium RIFCSPHIGHO2_12_FULL_43_28]|nr:MAG: hypothetical protein A3F14_05340 [Gammaproteobacteria bacterium RIFCSPHIGHO2_12_FULL_43_28]
MTTCPFDLTNLHPSWHACIQKGLASMDPAYLNVLTQSTDWLPGSDKLFNAFSLPREKVQYILIGESPYPRRESANGYAFWDAAVKELWSPTGLSKKVNRATSLRNILKMLLVAEGELSSNNQSQEAIAALDKKQFVQTNDAFFTNLIQHGFLLLNASLVLQESAPAKDAKAWQPFIHEVLNCLFEKNPTVTLILLGRIANTIDELVNHMEIERLYAEHPYNLSFITNPNVLQFFQPLHLLHHHK